MTMDRRSLLIATAAAPVPGANDRINVAVVGVRGRDHVSIFGSRLGARNDLLLAVATPERRLAPGQQIRVLSAPTHFRPVSYTLSGGEGAVRGTVELPQRTPYRDAWLTVRTPGSRKIASVAINGRPWSEFDAARSRIRLPKLGRLDIVVKTQ